MAPSPGCGLRWASGGPREGRRRRPRRGDGSWGPRTRTQPGGQDAAASSRHPGRDPRPGCPTYNLQADEGARVGPQDVGADGQGDPWRREGHGGVRGRRDWRSAGRHAAAVATASPRAAATSLRPPPPASASRAPAAAAAAARVRGLRARRPGGGRGSAVFGQAGPRPVTWAQVSAPPPRRPRGSRAQVRRPPGSVLPALFFWCPLPTSGQRSWSVSTPGSPLRSLFFPSFPPLVSTYSLPPVLPPNSHSSPTPLPSI